MEHSSYQNSEFKLWNWEQTKSKGFLFTTFLEFGLEEGTEMALSLRTHMYILLKYPDKKIYNIMHSAVKFTKKIAARRQYVCLNFT